jgi:ech hydrogenase subunit B
MKTALLCIGFIVFAPIIGGLLAGIDRIITARMQSRKGPPLLQPFYDVFKLLQKQNLTVNPLQNFYLIGFLVFVIATGCLAFSGGDLLLAIFALTVAAIFLVVGAFSANSPYSNIGAERELLQMVAYEPMLLLAAVGMYMATHSFNVSAILGSEVPVIKLLPGVFAGYLFILTIKLRKSPFDLSTSHHGHQELVKGLTTEFGGPSLALIEVAHWYENVLLMGFVYLFFGFNPLLAIGVVAATYFLEILIDNAYARLTWQFTIKVSWLVALVCGVGNLAVLYLIK